MRQFVLRVFLSDPPVEGELIVYRAARGAAGKSVHYLSALIAKLIVLIAEISDSLSEFTVKRGLQCRIPCNAVGKTRHLGKALSGS